MQAYGTILSCTVLQDHSGLSKCVGFVQFSGQEEAESSIAALHGKVLLVWPDGDVSPAYLIDNFLL